MESADKQLRVLRHGADQILPAEDFERRVIEAAEGRRPPLRVKFGMDPTTPDIHLGHSVVLRKLADFQRMGHTAVLLIGGFTAQVGDPSGRSATRPRLTAEQVRDNAATYLQQVRKVLSPDRLEVVNNSDWLTSLSLADVLGLTAQMTVARMLERADFAARYRSARPIAVSEFLYPLLQGQDSVAIRADVELGGTDQTFNLLVGRDLQAAAGQEPQCVLTMPLLEGLDGAAKMSKTAGNTIGVDDTAPEMFGRMMRLPDDLIVKYLRLVTDLDPDEVDRLEAGLTDASVHPNDLKRRLAREVVTLYHSADAARAAEERFNVQFREREIPDDIPDFPVSDQPRWFLPTLLQESRLCASGSDARRMVQQGAVRLDGDVLEDPTAELASGDLVGKVLQVGRRRFARLV